MLERYALSSAGVLMLVLSLLALACGSGKSVYDLEVGDCIVPPDTTSDEELVGSVESVDCSEPHDGEVTAVFDLDLDVDEYPGADRVSELALEGCPDKSSTVLYPSEESWGEGDREAVCILESIFDLNEGDCINYPTGTAGEVLSGVKRLDCADPHDAEVIGLLDMPDGDFPGEDEATDYALANCPAEFDNFLGPTEESWSQGDREIVCLDE